MRARAARTTRCRRTARSAAPTSTALRLPVAARGYRMADVDDVLDRLGAELAERDARIAELESALAGAQAAAGRGPSAMRRSREPARSGRQR